MSWGAPKRQEPPGRLFGAGYPRWGWGTAAMAPCRALWALGRASGIPSDRAGARRSSTRSCQELSHASPGDDGGLLKLTLEGIFWRTPRRLPASLLPSVSTDHFKEQCERQAAHHMAGHAAVLGRNELETSGHKGSFQSAAGVSCSCSGLRTPYHKHGTVLGAGNLWDHGQGKPTPCSYLCSGEQGASRGACVQPCWPKTATTATPK